MTVKIYGNTIDNCGTGISTPKDADVEIGANVITNCGTAIEQEIKNVSLLDYLSGAAILTTLVTGFYQLYNSSLVQQAIALFPK